MDPQLNQNSSENSFPQGSLSAPQPSHTTTSLLIFFVALSTLLLGLIGGYVFATRMSVQTGPAVQRNAGVTQTQNISPTMNMQTTTNTENMKIYTSTQYGLSFQYPSTWKVAPAFPNSTSSSIDFIGLTPINNVSKDAVSPIYAEHYDNPQNLSLQEFETQHNASLPMATQFYYPDATVSQIDGYTTYTKDKAGCEPLLCTSVTIMAKDNILIFFNVQNTNQFTPAELTANADVFSQLISSIKFTK